MSTEFDSAKIQSMLSQIDKLGSTKGTSIFGASSGNDYINSVWGLVQEGEKATSGNSEQKAQAINNIVKNLLGMIMSLGTKESAQAGKDVKDNDKKADDLSTKADKEANDIQNKVEGIVSQIATNSTDISKAITKIQELGGDKGQIGKAQKELEKQLQIIEENKNILNNGVSSPEAKETALAQLQNAASVINGLVASIGGYQKEVEAQNDIVNTATENVTGLIDESVTTVTDGTESLQNFIQQGQSQIVATTITSSTGAANEIVGAKATAMGSASSSVPVVGQTTSAKLLQIGADQTLAGKTRISESANTLKNLTQAIGEIGSNMSNLSNFTNSVGDVATEVVDLVGQYGAALDPIITATGSWTKVAETNTQFEQAIDDYQPSNKTQPIPNIVDILETSQTWGKTTNSNTQFNQENQQSQQGGQFNFDTNLFKQAFELKK